MKQKSGEVVEEEFLLQPAITEEVKAIQQEVFGQNPIL